MNKFTGALLATFASMAIASTAFAGEGVYVGAGLGMVFPERSTVNYTDPPNATLSQELSFRAGWGVNGALGYKWDTGLRTEFEVGYRRADMSRLNGVPASGFESATSFMGNVLYDVGNIPGFQPYVGLGVGVGMTDFHNVRRDGLTTIFTNGDTNLQWQAIGGASFPVADHMEAYMEYRYITVPANRFSGSIAGSSISSHDDRSHNVMLGLRFFFK